MDCGATYLWAQMSTGGLGGVVVNNVADAYRAEIGGLDVDSAKKMSDTNVFRLVDLTNRVVPSMKGAG